jgi:hypothetical protein
MEYIIICMLGGSAMTIAVILYIYASIKLKETQMVKTLKLRKNETVKNVYVNGLKTIYTSDYTIKNNVLSVKVDEKDYRVVVELEKII